MAILRRAIFLSVVVVLPVLLISGALFSIEESIELGGVNVVVFIGDGMGPNHARLAQLVEYGEHQDLFFQRIDQFPIQGLSRTDNFYNATTDSAAGATSIFSGIKTSNGRIAQDVDMNPVSSILTTAKDMGIATGIVTTSDITDATPASLYAKAQSRYDTDIIVDDLILMMTTGWLDIALGGGHSRFSSEKLVSLENGGVDVISTKSQLDDMRSNLGGGEAETVSYPSPLLGLFAESHMAYELDRDFSTQPSLVEMAEVAVKYLKGKSNFGFLLLVEGSKIDKAAHVNDGLRNVLETIEFDEAISSTVGLVEAISNQPSLFLVTADHECGGLSLPEEQVQALLDANVPLPSSEDRGTRRRERVTRKEAIKVEWSTDWHTSAHVPVALRLWNGTNVLNEPQCVWSILPELEHGKLENNRLHLLLEVALLDELSCFRP